MCVTWFVYTRVMMDSSLMITFVVRSEDSYQPRWFDEIVFTFSYLYHISVFIDR